MRAPAIFNAKNVGATIGRPFLCGCYPSYTFPPKKISPVKQNSVILIIATFMG